MSIKTFTKEQIKILSKNQYVKKVSDKAITYSDEFKQIFLSEYQNGLLPSNIFKKYGFDTSILGAKRIHTASLRWRRAYENEGIMGLSDTRKGNSGRPREKDLSIEEKYERLKAQNQLLKAENELLKKLKAMERGLDKIK